MKKSLFLFLLLSSIQGFSQTYQSNIQKADSLYEKKEFKQALNLYEDAFRLTSLPIRDGDYYNAACIAALDGQTEKAISYLKKSVESGWIDITHMQKDEDLILLRQTPQWKEIIEAIETKFQDVKNEVLKIKDYEISELIPFKKGGHWGYLHYVTSKVIVKPIFDTLTFFHVKTAEAIFKNEYAIMINLNGTFTASRDIESVKTEPRCFKMPKSQEDIIKEKEEASKDDRLFKKLVPIKDWIEPSNRGYGTKTMTQFFFYQDVKGETGLQKSKPTIDDKENKYRVNEIDSIATFFREDECDIQRPFDYYPAVKNGKWGIVNQRMDWQIKPIYDEIKRCKRICFKYCDSERPFYTPYFLVRIGNEEFVVNTDGRKYLPD